MKMYFNLRKLFILALLCSYVPLICCGGSDDNTEEEKGGENGSYTILTNYLPIADPYIMLYNNKYYAYGTKVGTGFNVYVSDDLKYWKEEDQLALSSINSYGTSGYWAPEVYYIKGKFYMFYTSEEHICVATASSPIGPFVQDEKKPIWTEASIDTSLFIDEDGTPYLYFVRFTNGNVIWVAEMNENLKSIKEETLKECVKADQSWELSMGKVAEGPSLLKKNNTYYLIYSANDYRSQDYGVGFATSQSPMGPWVKYSGNPILQKDQTLGLVGTGHGAPFMAKDGSYRYVFHAHWSSLEVAPRTSYIKDFAISGNGVASISGTTIKPKVVK